MKIIATDFDGTLSYNGKVSDEDKEAIKRFRRAGNKFGIVTGRDLELSTWIRSNFADYDFIISCTGAVISDNEGNILYEKKQRVDKVLEDIVSFSLERGAGTFVISNRLTRHYIDVRGKIETDFSQIKEFTHCNTWFYNGENAGLLEKYIREKYPDSFVGYRNGGSVDMPPHNTSKSTGILEYASRFDDPKIYTVGDNYNDLGMIKDFDSFAVSNAIPEVKAAAKHQCDRIADMIEYIMEENDK